jgi:hypothetical protein
VIENGSRAELIPDQIRNSRRLVLLWRLPCQPLSNVGRPRDITLSRFQLLVSDLLQMRWLRVNEQLIHSRNLQVINQSD